MSSPQTLIRRNLTFNFERSIKIVNGQQVPQTMEVSITALTSPSMPAAQVTLVGGVQEQTVLLNQETNSVTFQLVPSSAPGLTGVINYLAAFRQGGITGATETQPFSMPDFDTDYDELSSLGALLGGASFLQQSDLGVAGRVARLNDAGQVVDASGDPVAMPADLTAVVGQINAEVVARQQADQQNYQVLSTSITQQTGLAVAQAKSYTDTQVQSLTAMVENEAGERNDAVAAVQTNLNTVNTTLSGEITTLQGGVATNTTALTHKADLDSNGYVPINQMNPAAVMNWIEVADVTHMLALRYPQDVQPGDLALTPTAIYGFLGPPNSPDPSQLSNWRLLNDVLSVNGKTGTVVLTASDVGAVAATNGSILMTQVTGLSTALAALAPQTQVNSLQTALTTIQNDGTYVHTTSGVISDAVLPANIALISSAGNITKKDGSVVAIGEGSGVSSVNGQSGAVTLTASDVGALATNGTITESQVTGLVTDLANRVLTSDSRLTNARTPTTHASTHASGGSDPITVAQTQVTGLSTTLTTTSNNISSLQTRVTTLEASGPGGYGAGTGLFFAASAPTGDFVDNVMLHSPFGYNPTNPNANLQGYYMDPAGAAGADAVWPHFFVSGALAFSKWGAGNTPDPYYAAANDLTTLSGMVATKANQSDMTTVQNTLTTLATAASVTSLATTVSSKANSSDLAALTTTVNGKANSSDLSALSSTVATKANQSDMTAAQTSISTINAALPSKADLVAGSLKTSQIPTGIPQANIANLVAQLAHMNSSGLFDAAYLTDWAGVAANAISMAAINGLSTALAGKASLGTDGKLLPSLLPALGITDTFVVSSQSAMLGLTTAHQGDICIINSGVNIGTYILSASDPTQLANWVQLQFPTTAVTSVNGQTGTVVLAASDVGAMASNAVIPQSQISGLVSALAALASNSALSAAIATVTTPAQVQTLMSTSAQNKQSANLVATTAIASLSGQQSVDGVLTPLGSTVLATAQSSSVNNGLWVVNSGAWTRTTDFSSGTWLVRGSEVVVSQGNSYANTLWQVTSASGIIDTNANNWANIGNVAPPLLYTAGNGMNLTGQQFAVKPATGGGIAVASGGVSLDPNVAVRKAIIAVPSTGSSLVTLTHNLNTNRVSVQIIDVASGNLVDLGRTITGVNTVQVEFGNPPATGQYVAFVWG